MTILELNKKVLNNEITLEEVMEIYNKYQLAFIVKDGQIKGFTR